MNKEFSLLAVFIISILIVTTTALAFEVETKLETNTVCSEETIIIVNYISGQAGLYELNLEGNVKLFSTLVPSSFYLEEGKTEPVYIYITPKSDTNPSEYSLSLKIKQGSETKEVQQSIIVENCHTYSVKLEPKKLNLCPCDNSNFELTIDNKGKYNENYQIRVSGSGKKFVVLEKEEINLGPEQKETINTNINIPCDALGEYPLVFDILNENENKKIDSSINVKPCYEYDVGEGQVQDNLCEKEIKIIPITIKNTGTVRATYTLNLENAPEWVNLPQKQITLQDGEEKVIEIEASPDYNIKGDFQFTLKAKSNYANIEKEVSIILGIRECYFFNVNIEGENETICNEAEREYEVKVKNVGEKTLELKLELGGPEWAIISENLFTLKPQEEKSVILKINPKEGTPASLNDIKVKAIHQESGKTAEDSIKIETSTREECFFPSIEVEKTSLDVAQDSSSTIKFTIENRGKEPALYDLELSGSASEFVIINPEELELEPGKPKEVFLYIAVPKKQELKEYEAVVTLKLKDSTILSSKKVRINVLERGAITGEAVSETETAGKEFFNKIISWVTNTFNKIFKKEKITRGGPETTEEDLAQQPVYPEEEQEQIEEKETEEPLEVEVEEVEPEEEINITNKTVIGEENITEEETNETEEQITEGELTKFEKIWKLYKWYIIVILIILLIYILYRTGFWKKTGEFFKEEEPKEKPEEEQKKEKSKPEEEKKES